MDLYRKVFHGKFSIRQILECEGRIVVNIGLKGEKSKHFSTFYDETIHKIHELSKEMVCEFFRQAVIIWIYPTQFFKKAVSYSEIYKVVLGAVLKESEVAGVKFIEEIFVKLKCENLTKNNERIRKIPL